ncbi:MAG: methylated-DNA--[protein]-cysteine S-methyltransferase, partial [Gemmatimonadetes bacterium]|nr:methylated-DNA--[protein]-cysteine S-methyltransferase [Gemmatimonadota bacterium]
MNGTVLYTRLDSPLGALLLTSDGEALTGVFMEEHRHGPRMGDGWRRDDAPFAAAREQLDGYFAGERTEFDLPLAPAGTPFQRRVWEELRGIPFGESISYAELARRIGDPKAVRAVGGANGRNPLSVVVPC